MPMSSSYIDLLVCLTGADVFGCSPVFISTGIKTDWNTASDLDEVSAFCAAPVLKAKGSDCKVDVDAIVGIGS